MKSTGFILSTEMVIAIIAAILIISSVAFLNNTRATQIDLQPSVQIQTMIETQTGFLTNQLVHEPELQDPTCDQPPFNCKNASCYTLYDVTFPTPNPDFEAQVIGRTNCTQVIP